MTAKGFEVGDLDCVNKMLTDIPPFLRRKQEEVVSRRLISTKPRYVKPKGKSKRKSSAAMAALRILGWRDHEISRLTVAQAQTVWNGSISPGEWKKRKEKL